MELPTIIELIATAVVTDIDIQQAIEDWKAKPPDEIYTNLIDPEIDDD